MQDANSNILSFRPNLGGRTVRFAAENSYPPFQLIDPPSGLGTGWDYDAMRSAAKLLNIVVDFKAVDWHTALGLIADGSFDIGMSPVKATEDHLDKLDVSDSYAHVEMRMLVRADEQRFSDAPGFAALGELLFGTRQGFVSHIVGAREFIGGDENDPRIRLFETFDEELAALRDGSVDLLMLEGAVGEALVEDNPGSFGMVGDPLLREEFAYVLPKGSDFLVPMNAAIAAMKANGTFAQLKRKWLVDWTLDNDSE